MRQYVSSQRNFIEMLKYINCYGYLWPFCGGILSPAELIRNAGNETGSGRPPHPRGAGGMGERHHFCRFRRTATQKVGTSAARKCASEV